MKSKRPPHKDKLNAGQLIDLIIESIQEKKGGEIVTIDLTNIDEAVCDYFIICHANSSIQIKAITEYIVKNIKDKSGEGPWKKEGLRNLEWVLLDYINVVVHIFHKEKRGFYHLEELWSDGVLAEIAE